MTATNIDYTATCFKYPTPTPINSEPTNKSLKKLKTELRVNVSNVDTDLGGDHGYLGLILSDIEYTWIQPYPTPFASPKFPPTLIIDALTTAVEVVQTRETHHEHTRFYRECKNGEKALLRHIHSAIEDKYIEHLVYDDTGLIQDDIPTVLGYLFTNYSKVTSKEVEQKKAEVHNFVFNSVDPMVFIYRPIKKLQKLATAARIPYFIEQQLEFGLTVIRSTWNFEKVLSKRKAKVVADKTWNNFKLHFCDSQLELK